MKIQRVRLTHRPINYFRYAPNIFKVLLAPIKIIPSLTGMVIPLALFLTLYFFGLPGVLLTDGRYACNYQDFISTYGTGPINERCPPIYWRRFPIFPWQKG